MWVCPAVLEEMCSPKSLLVILLIQRFDPQTTCMLLSIAPVDSPDLPLAASRFPLKSKEGGILVCQYSLGALPVQPLVCLTVFFP